MDARPSPEQRQLEDAAKRMVATLGPTTVGDLDDERRRARLDAALEQAGWRELRSGTPDQPLASGVECAIVARELARGCCDTPFLGPLLAADLLRHCGVDDVGGPVTIGVSADLSGLGGGTSWLAIDAANAAQAVVVVDSGGTKTLAVAPIGSHHRGVDLTRPVGKSAGAGVAVAVESASALSDGAALRWEALAVSLTAADLVGAMEGAVQLATEYAKQRQQYGSAIGSYQAVQHLLAEATTLTEGAMGAMVHAAWAVDALSPAEARAASAVAKAYASRAARTVCETAIQVHGGIGNTWECMAHVYLRRAVLSTELFGGDGEQLKFLARERWGAN